MELKVLNTGTVMADTMQLLPMLVLWAAASLILLGDVWWWKNRKEYNPALAIGGVLIALALYLKQLRIDELSSQAYFGGAILVDGKAIVTGIALLITALLSILMAWTYLRQQGLDHGEYYVLLLLSVSGAMLMAHANDLIVVFLGLEILSFALYVLAGFARTDPKSEEASIKYFLLGAFASAFLLYGIALVYGATQTTNLDAIFVAIRKGQIHSPIMLGGVALLVVGLGFKAAVIPFHQWTPDVYEGAPTSVTAFMAGAAKIGAFIAFFRVFDKMNLLSAYWLPAIQIIAILTMVVGNLLAVTQTNLKRLLAYSSIAHAGYLLVAVAAIGHQGKINGVTYGVAVRDLATTGALFYLFAYTFMTLGAFGVLIFLGNKGKEYQQITDLRGLARTNPFAAYAMMFFMLSLGGIPPTMGFMGKWQIFMGAVAAHEIMLAVVLALSSIIAVFYYLRVVYMMIFEEPVGEAPTAKTEVSNGAYVTVVLAVVATVLFGVMPGLLTSITSMAK